MPAAQSVDPAELGGLCRSVDAAGASQALEAIARRMPAKGRWPRWVVEVAPGASVPLMLHVVQERRFEAFAALAELAFRLCWDEWTDVERFALNRSFRQSLDVFDTSVQLSNGHELELAKDCFAIAIISHLRRERHEDRSALLASLASPAWCLDVCKEIEAAVARAKAQDERDEFESILSEAKSRRSAAKRI